MIRNLPNILSLSRIAAIPALVALAVSGTTTCDLLASAVFAAAGITDYLDGKLARDWQLTSDLGRMLDPIADKLLVGACLMVLVGTGRAGTDGLFPALVIMLREILVSGLREYLASARVRLPVTSLAKWKTGFQMAALGFLLAGDTGAAAVGIGWLPVRDCGIGMLWLAAALTIVTGWGYLRIGIHHAVASRDT